MSLLDQPKTNRQELFKRQCILRANIHARALAHGIAYSQAVEEFGQEIGRSPTTIFMWMTSGKDLSGGHRPLPKRHFDTLVENGLIDPSLTHINGKLATPKSR